MKSANRFAACGLLLSITLPSLADISYVMSDQAPDVDGKLTGSVIIGSQGRVHAASDAPPKSEIMEGERLVMEHADDGEHWINGATEQALGELAGHCDQGVLLGLSAEQMILQAVPVDTLAARVFGVQADDAKYHGEPPITVPAGWNGEILAQWFNAQERIIVRNPEKISRASCEIELAVAFSATRSYWVTFGGALSSLAGGDPSALSKLSDVDRASHFKKYVLLEARLIKRNLRPIVDPVIVNHVLKDASVQRALYSQMSANNEVVE